MATLTLQDYALNDLSKPGNYTAPTTTTTTTPTTTPTPTPTPTTTTAPATLTREQQIADIQARANQIQSDFNALASQKEATVGQSMGDIGFEQGPTYEEIYGIAPDENQIYRDKLKMFQKDIDATNQVYDQMLAQARLEGQGRLGSTRAISARSGLLGSDFGASQKEKTIGINTGITQGIQAERAAKIGSIMGEVRKSVLDEVKAKNEARQQGAENYISYLASTATRKEQNLNKAAQAFLLQGIDPSELDPTELAEIAKEGGLTPDAIKMQYRMLKAQQDAESAKADLDTRKTESEIAKNERMTVGEGTAVLDKDGNVIYKNPKTSTSSSGLRVAGGVVAPEEIADVHATLNESRGEDRYANTQVYMDEFNGFVASGGDPKDFIKEYDPNTYINPNDPTRSFLQAYMKTTAREAVEKELTALEQLQQLQQMQATN
jgi:hypothetical protein